MRDDILTGVYHPSENFALIDSHDQLPDGRGSNSTPTNLYDVDWPNLLYETTVASTVLLVITQLIYETLRVIGLGVASDDPHFGGHICLSDLGRSIRPTQPHTNIVFICRTMNPPACRTTIQTDI